MLRHGIEALQRCVAREIGKRNHVYRRLCEENRMDWKEAAYETELMQDLRTLLEQPEVVELVGRLGPGNPQQDLFG